MHEWSIALGFYQSPQTAQAVIKKLQKSSVGHLASIQHLHDDRVVVKSYHSFVFLLWALLALILTSVLYYLFPSLDSILLPILAIETLGLISGLAYIYHNKIDKELIYRFKLLVARDETLVMTLVRPGDVALVLGILRRVEKGHPLTFLLRPDDLQKIKSDETYSKEPLTIEELNEHAVEVAKRFKEYHFAVVKTRNKQNLLKRLKQSAISLNMIRHHVMEAEQIEQIVSGSAEWLIDNNYIIQGNIEEIQRNLPNKYYQELPKFLDGPFKGFPKTYALAKEMVDSTANRLNRENMIAFLTKYQTIDELTIGELWAIPLMLRLRLIECIQFLSMNVGKNLIEDELAGLWGNRLLSIARTEPDRLPTVIQQLSNEQPNPSSHFAEELLDHLFDEETVLPLVKNWLEKHFKENIADVLHKEQNRQTADEVALSNAIISLIGLTQLSWQEVFEIISPIDSILSKDPRGTYAKMDFNTRDMYRHSIEIISKHSKKSQSEIAHTTLELAEQGSDDVRGHVGYYLIDDGRPILEEKVKCRATFLQRLRRFMMNHSSLVYLGSIALITFLIEYYLYHLSLSWKISCHQTLFFTFMALLPVIEISVQFVNMLATQILAPFVLPKMSFKNEIPDELRTLVIIPTLLSSENAISDSLSHLEIHFLANQDSVLRFGIFGDFLDSTEQVTQEDKTLLEFAIQGIEGLGEKYGHDKFFLFHRERVWSDSEGAWIGWERKRGKLECLNRYLIHSDEPNCQIILKSGKREALAGIRFIITLDDDTQLPKNTAKKLIETLSHPLNLPHVTQEGHVVRGYGIIQPRVNSLIFNENPNFFEYIFSDISGIDPYTQAVSDVYQDLTREGTYHGKGIYDIKAFQKILSEKFPEEHLLSHDLIEGAFVRVGYASDIALYDTFPKNYLTWSIRAHRWMRGDWQLIDWLFPKIPQKKRPKVKNTLSLINRWKIFDNLRRSLTPIAITALLVSDWLFSPAILTWTIIAVIVLLMPKICLFISTLLTNPQMSLTWKELIRDTWRFVISLALLPHQALVSLDALIRATFRRLVSHRHLLEWATAHHLKSAKQSSLYLNLGLISLFSLGILLATAYLNPACLAIALPFCVLWGLSPLTVYILDHFTLKEIPVVLNQQDQLFLRELARKTWRYFDDFVGPQTHWLPPDNYQAALSIEVAQRTSPTNIGLWLLSLLSAYDLKFITCDDLIDKTLATIQTLRKLDMYEGHFLNWYDIEKLKPLYPRYVSTVDSGNLLGFFWTLEQGIDELLSQPILSAKALEGIKDTYHILLSEDKQSQFEQDLLAFKKYFSISESDIIHTIHNLQQALKDIQELKKNLTMTQSETLYWIGQLEKQLLSWNAIINRYFSWILILKDISYEHLHLLSPHAAEWRKKIFESSLSIHELATGNLSPELRHFLEYDAENTNHPLETVAVFKKLQESLKTAIWFAGEKLELAQESIREIYQLVEGTNMRFLYNADRNLFSIGYHVDDFRLDNSYYDLLASEARIASLVAIAKGDVPLTHWWALGRPYGVAYGRRVLLSWGGTMFEYLMPQLINRRYRDSLLGQACDDAVACQMAYGKQRGIPWGISEAAFSEIDNRRTYQYRSFGVPGLGIKRGLEKDLVVSPYSTALALMIKPKEAINNLKELKKSPNNLWSLYGYYESIDFARQQGPQGERGVIVYAFMAHHQGMSLVSINNTLNRSIMCARFHADPRIRGVQSLLYEKIPTNPRIAKETRKDIPISRLTPFSSVPIMGIVDTPYGVTPKVNLLSNGEYSLMVTNSGGGYSKWRDFDITRWRSDTTCDLWGSFCYIKDTHSGQFWSSGYHPTNAKSTEYTVSFKSDKAEIRRRDHLIETVTEIVVSPEDNVEIRLMTLGNLSKEIRYLEITSYSELVLAPHGTDRAHPAFNKFFIQTEALPKLNGLLAFRRARSPDDLPIWVAHGIASTEPLQDMMQFETDRNKFIGRGHTLKNPAALNRNLSQTQGTVLDPIFSLRCQIVIKPGQRVQVSFITAASDNREAAVSLIKKYGELTAHHRAIEMAWTHSQLELRHLRVHQEEAQLFQKLAGRILYPHVQLRPSVDRLHRNHLGQSHLWTYGISGDMPIVVVTVSNPHDLYIVRQALTAHAFWSMRGLKVDLIIFNEEITSYDNPLYEQLKRIVQSYPYFSFLQKPGGIYLINCDQVPEEDFNLILSVARAHLVAARGSLRQQLVSPILRKTNIPLLVPNKMIHEEPSKPLPFLELAYFNSLGGFTPDGKEYVIYLGPTDTTPAPWINVISNPEFGALITEAGPGCTWYGNSQSNRLTPWSNDPILNPICDVIYIRDDELGTYWTPTPSPIRELDAYRIRHGQGYTRFEHNSHGIQQELLTFIPVNSDGGIPVKIQRLSLLNTSSHRRFLSIYSYVEWVLGTDREETQMHIITEWDKESQAIFAYNRYHPDFGDHVAFMCCCGIAESFSTDRAEFIGRNRSLSNPEALDHQALSGISGAALDPCGSLQMKIDIGPGEQIEQIFVLGYAPNVETARQYIHKVRDYSWIDQAYAETQSWWDNILGTIQVDIPELSLNFALNRWLLYQNLSCRIWGRTAFYQSSGAFGFRDQLQDVMALVYTAPHLTREQILKAASRQFIEGDVQHWWHPPSGGGVRTKISDDLLWLPFVTAHYMRVTQDTSILNEVIPFLKGEILKEDQSEIYFTPEVSSENGTLLEHCRRAIQKGTTAGPHGLPLIGSGDWNDGMNHVGIKGKGESVWLGWFLIHVLNDFADLLSFNGQGNAGDDYRNQAKRLGQVLEESSWDGKWYRRAYYDDGSPLGSISSGEDIIDSLPQSWAVISGAGDLERATKALNSVIEHLVKPNENMVLLLTPPFDQTPQDPGYIKGYPPGVRENGGQYTHGSLWVPLAFARKGDGSNATNLLRLIHPTGHIVTPEDVKRYQVEPYVLAGDVYDLAGQRGRGGWTWYTGSTSWMYRIWIEEIFGFHLRGDKLRLDPTLSPKWEKITLHYKRRETLYKITIENPQHVSKGHITLEVDGIMMTSNEIHLIEDGGIHHIKVLLS